MSGPEPAQAARAGVTVGTTGAARTPWTREARRAHLPELLADRILVLDGAMGTLLQQHRFDEADFRGDRFRDHPRDLRGDNDVLTLTQPDAVRAVHAAYFAAGADVATTDSFTATRIAQADYGLEDAVREMNAAAARLAREAGDAAEAADPGRPRYVAGSLGPTNRTASLSPDVDDPGARNVTWEELEAAYREAAEGLLDGGADILLVETVFDTLNAKAAIAAVKALEEETGERIPLAISGTIVDASGRTLSGQTVEAFWHSVRHADPVFVGLNCALGPRQLREHVVGPRGDRRPAGLRLSQRGPPQRAGRVRRDPRGDGRRARRVGGRGPPQRGGRLLRHDPGARRGDRGRGPWPPAARDPGGPGGHAPGGAGGAGDPAARERLRQRRGADERHRVAEVRRASSRTAARTRRWRSRASRSRTARSSST